MANRVVDKISKIRQNCMTITPRLHRPICRQGLENNNRFNHANPAIPAPSSSCQEAISRDLVIALEITERLNKSLDGLIEEDGCSEFLDSHRLLNEKITSNRNILLALVGNIMDISIKSGKRELKANYSDYFTK